MKVNASNQLPVYQVIGQKLLIHWDEQIIQKESMTGEVETMYEYNEADAFVYDTRADLIEKIIGSVYNTGAEIATINNKDSKPDEYAAYQAFREQAKALADGWLNKGK